MRFGETFQIFLVGLVAFVIFYSFGMNLWLALAISVVLFVLGLSTLNYLNAGKFRPFIRSNSPNQR